MVSRTVLCATCILGLVGPALAAKPLPWQRWIDTPIIEQTKDLESLFDLNWRNSGGKEGNVSVAEDEGPWGGKHFDFRVEIDHHNAGQYPMGWPSFETQPDPPLDFSGFDALQYWILCDAEMDLKPSIRFILWGDKQLRINTPLPVFEPGNWVQITHKIKQIPGIDKVERLHFYVRENEYKHGDKMTFRIGGFRLCNTKQVLSRLEPDQAAMGLWVGDRADTGDQVVLLDQGAEKLPALMAFETGENVALKASDTVRVRFHEVFSGAQTWQTVALGSDIAAGSIGRVETSLDTSKLTPGYYLVVADLQRAGESLLGGRVGCDDFYIKKPGETMTYTVLSVRTGMVQWVRDLLHGDIMCRTRIALPHVYDPLDETTYPEFIELHGQATGKHTEGNEAGDTGIALAAEAFRKSGDTVRAGFTEGLLDESLNSMMATMQAPGGGTITWVNQLADKGIGKGARSNAFGSYDSNQMGEWMRALTYGIIYYSDRPDKREYAMKLNAACRKAADYLVAHSLQTADGLPKVLRHLRLNEQPDGTVDQVVYHQEGRQCNVYLGRALAGLSYYAYAMQLLGDTVPDAWWEIMDNTVTWCDRRMKPNGWFDWQCGDEVEGGCHTFLGNIYIGEGIFGCYLADKMAGRGDAAGAAARTTLRAYRYVTDDCFIKGRKYEYPLEFWVGPYVYWLFTEYVDTIGPDEKLEDWLTVLDNKWSVERGWSDFLDRAPTGGCGRTTTNGMLEVSILGYLGIKQMAEVGRPLHWRLN